MGREGDTTIADQLETPKGIHAPEKTKKSLMERFQNVMRKLGWSRRGEEKEATQDSGKNKQREKEGLTSEERAKIRVLQAFDEFRKHSNSRGLASDELVKEAFNRNYFYIPAEMKRIPDYKHDFLHASDGDIIMFSAFFTKYCEELLSKPKLVDKVLGYRSAYQKLVRERNAQLGRDSDDDGHSAEVVGDHTDSDGVRTLSIDYKQGREPHTS